MGHISLLDCTLRDGGYINDWHFGYEAMLDITTKITQTKVDVVEIGFIRDEETTTERAVFNSMGQAQNIAKLVKQHSNDTVQTAVMAEISNPISLDKVETADKNNIDIVRVIVWKSRRNSAGQFVDALQDSYEYCKGFVEKGYKLCVQPNRTNQYSASEFADLLKMFARLSPMAIYVVDSWGTMYADEVIGYMEIADKILPSNIAIGFHGHNNMQQAFSNAERVVAHKFNRDVIIDASVYGIGRGAGNLPLELMARYLNQKSDGNYDILPMLEIYDRYIRPLREQYAWGSSMPFFLSADADANPNYAAYFDGKISSPDIRRAFAQMSAEERLIFARGNAEKFCSLSVR